MLGVFLKPGKSGPGVFARGFCVLGYAEKPGACERVWVPKLRPQSSQARQGPCLSLPGNWLHFSRLGMLLRSPGRSLAPSAGGLSCISRSQKIQVLHPGLF